MNEYYKQYGIEKGFTKKQEDILIEEGIKKGVVIVNLNASLEHLKYKWKDLIEKYKVYIDVKDRSDFQ